LKKRSLVLLGLAVLLSGSFTVAGARQQDGKPVTEPVFSRQLIPLLNYPAFKLRETGTGLTGVPTRLPAGRYRVVLEAPETTPSHVVLVQYPQGLSREKAEELLVEAAGQDTAAEGWVYGGGAFSPPGTTIEFIIDLKPGDWHLAATRESVRPTSGCGGSANKNAEPEEWATLYPIQVTESSAQPEEPPAGVEFEMDDYSFAGLGETLTPGPKIWKITATGTQPRHMTFFKTPKHLTADELRQIIMTPPGEMPPNGLPLFSQFVWSGDISIASPGHTTWIEYDLKPGHYMFMSWSTDAESGAPALFLGMAHGLTVQ
jgi:hypothetical protein